MMYERTYNVKEENDLRSLISELVEYEDREFPEKPKYVPKKDEDFKVNVYSRWAIEEYLELLEDLPFFAPSYALESFLYRMIEYVHKTNDRNAGLQFTCALNVIKEIDRYVERYSERPEEEFWHLYDR